MKGKPKGSSLATGIVVSETDRLVLRPWPIRFGRSTVLRFAVFCAALVVLAALGFWLLFRAYVSAYAVAVAATICALLVVYQNTTEVTFIALRGAEGIIVETRNRLVGTRRRKLLHRYAGIKSVRLERRMNRNALTPGASPTGALMHDYVLLEIGGRKKVFWYTRYPEAARDIARVVASFAGVPLLDYDERTDGRDRARG